MAKRQTNIPAPTPGQPPVPPVEIESVEPEQNPSVGQGSEANEEPEADTLGNTDTSSENLEVDETQDQESTIGLDPNAEEEEDDEIQDKTDAAILKRLLTDLPHERFNTAVLSGRFEGIVMPHQRYLLENYFGRDGVKYTQGMARLFSKFGSPETGYAKLEKLYKKLNK